MDTIKDYRLALALAVFTVVYNLAEGAVAIYFGFEDETISLFGFGVDSLVEVISGVGIWHMILRIRAHGSENADLFERRALRITAVAFYILAMGLVATAGLQLVEGHEPQTSFWGVVISLVSISFMWLLIRLKVREGTRLGSQAILADANCSKACMHFSLVLLLASLGYELTGIGWFDSLGALGLAYLAFKEGRESWGKAKGKSCGCSSSCSSAKLEGN